MTTIPLKIGPLDDKFLVMDSVPSDILRDIGNTAGLVITSENPKSAFVSGLVKLEEPDAAARMQFEQEGRLVAHDDKGALCLVRHDLAAPVPLSDFMQNTNYRANLQPNLCRQLDEILINDQFFAHMHVSIAEQMRRARELQATERVLKKRKKDSDVPPGGAL